MVLDLRGFPAASAASTSTSSGCGEPINWTLFSHLAKGATLALAIDYPPTTTAAAAIAAPVAAAEEKRLAGLSAFALAAAVPGPRAGLALGKTRAAGAAGSGSVGGGGSVIAELMGMLSGVQLVRRGLAERLLARPRAAAAVGAAAAAAGGGRGGSGGRGVACGSGTGGGGRAARIDVKECVIRCAMTGAQAEVYSAIAR